MFGLFVWCLFGVCFVCLRKDSVLCVWFVLLLFFFACVLRVWLCCCCDLCGLSCLHVVSASCCVICVFVFV